MRAAQVPKDVLAAEIRAGRVTVGSMGNPALLHGLGAVVDAVAARGLEKAAQGAPASKLLRFPVACCNCLAEARVRAVDSASIVNRGVPYTFRFAIPHCGGCLDTANRKRPGLMGFFAAFLAVGLPVLLAFMLWGAATNRDGLIAAAFVAGPLAGLALPWAWTKLRRPRVGQSSRYQAVYASEVDVGLSGVPEGFVLSFANPAYAARFAALNRDIGVIGG